MQTNLKSVSNELKRRQSVFNEDLRSSLKPEYYNRIQNNFRGLLGKELIEKNLLEVPKGQDVVLIRTSEISLISQKFNTIIKNLSQVHNIFKLQYDSDLRNYIRNKDMRVSIGRDAVSIDDPISELLLSKIPEMTKKLNVFVDHLENMSSGNGFDIDIDRGRRRGRGSLGRIPMGKAAAVVGAVVGLGALATYFAPTISKGLDFTKNKISDIGRSAKNIPPIISKEIHQNTSEFAQSYRSEVAGKPTGTTSRHMKVLYDAFREQGMTHEGAKTMIAQIGRENSFQERYLFGTHIDPANNSVNAGMISWQGSRGKEFLEFMRNRGMVDSQGKIIKGNESLKAQAAFVMHELKTKSEYKKSLKALTTEGLTYPQIESVVGDNYIRWRRTDPKYSAAGYRNQNQFYGQVASIVDDSKSSVAGIIGGKMGATVRNAGEFVDDVQEVSGDLLQYVRLSKSTVNLSGLHPAMRRRFQAMAAEYYSITGKKIQVNSAYRSTAEQAKLYKLYGPGRAAPPGRSRHESGLAIDIQSNHGNQLMKMGLLQKYGFHRPVRGEPWHIEPIEGRNIKSEPDNPYSPGKSIITVENKKDRKFIDTSQKVAIDKSKPRPTPSAPTRNNGKASTLSMSFGTSKKEQRVSSARSSQYSEYFS